MDTVRFCIRAIRLFSSFWGTRFAERCSALRYADRSAGGSLYYAYLRLFTHAYWGRTKRRCGGSGNPTIRCRSPLLAFLEEKVRASSPRLLRGWGTGTTRLPKMQLNVILGRSHGLSGHNGRLIC